MKTENARRAAVAATALFALSAGPSWAQVSDDVVRIGVLTDMNGIFSDNSGAGSVAATELAIEDVGGKVLGKPIEVVSGDHQNKPDIASNMARQWIDESHVDVIADVIGSAVTYAVLEIAKEKDVAMLMTGAGASDLTGQYCSPVSVHWVWDTYSFGGVLGKALADNGAKSFYFITVDYSYGEQMQRDVTRAIEAAGGTVVGSIKHPFGTSDYASHLLAAQSSGADAVVLANAGGDTMNSAKQANEFGLRDAGQELGAVLGLNELMAAGLENVQGILAPSAWYWDLDDESRAFAERYKAKTGKLPSEFHAGVYSSVLHYLKAVEAAGTDEATKAVAKMKELPVKDVFARNAELRADGRLVHDMYLIRAKSSAESTQPGDVAEIVATIPGNDAFRPLDQGGCPLVK